MLEFRCYQPGDEEGIVALLSLVFGEKRGLDWWHWYYESNPAGQGLIRIALDQGRIVGHRALVPYRIWTGREYAVACQATDAATCPDYQGRGIFRRLTEEVLAAAGERGWAFVFSFPNEKSLPINRRLGWIPGQKVRKWVKPLLRLPARGNNNKDKWSVREKKKVGEEFTKFWETYGTSSAAGIHKDAGYLKWRYCDNPRGKDYVILVLERQGGIRAYGVVGIEGNKGHLLEFMPGSVDPLLLLRGVENYLGGRGVRFITMWPPRELPVPPWRLGYVPNLGRAGVLAFRPLTGEISGPWRVTPGDTDYA